MFSPYQGNQSLFSIVKLKHGQPPKFVNDKKKKGIIIRKKNQPCPVLLLNPYPEATIYCYIYFKSWIFKCFASLRSH